MNIPIQNVYYLFVYAWARFSGGTVANVGVQESPDIPNLFAKLLATGLRQLLRRGLDRGYSSFTDELIAPRGRLRLDRMLKEASHVRGRAICDYDELTHDVLHNQIIKATLRNLTRCVQVTKDLKHELMSLDRRLYDVQDRPLSASIFRNVMLSRNNREYRFLLRLCEFVFWALMPDEASGSARFQNVLEDETRMSSVFQDFLRNFFQMHCAQYRVRSEALGWDVSDATEADLAFLPRMLTDVTFGKQTTQ